MPSAFRLLGLNRIENTFTDPRCYYYSSCYINLYTHDQYIWSPGGHGSSLAASFFTPRGLVSALCILTSRRRSVQAYTTKRSTSCTKLSTTRANPSGNALQEAGTRPFRPTANIDRMIDTLTGSLRENLTSLLGAKSETYVHERMAGVAIGY